MPPCPAPGIYADVPTFFEPEPSDEYEGYNVDFTCQTAHALSLAKNGVKGIVIGSTGEFVHLSLNEKAAIVTSVRVALDQGGYSGFPVYVGIIQEGVPATIKEIAVMKRSGAEMALVLAPGYFGNVSRSQEGLIKWYTMIADASPLPVIMSHFPLTTNNLELLPDTIVELSKHRNIVGIKLSLDSMSHCCQVALNPAVVGTNFVTLLGYGQALLPAMEVGLEGAIDGVAAAFPCSMVRLYNLKLESTAESLEDARSLQYCVCRAAEILRKYGPLAVKYLVCRSMGFSAESEYCRSPLESRIPNTEKLKYEPDIHRLFELEKAFQSNP